MTTMSNEQAGIPKIVINLMKGVVYQEADPALWQQLLAKQTAIAEYVAVLGLFLLVDESEGYAFLKYKELFYLITIFLVIFSPLLFVILKI